MTVVKCQRGAGAKRYASRSLLLAVATISCAGRSSESGLGASGSGGAAMSVGGSQAGASAGAGSSGVSGVSGGGSANAGSIGVGGVVGVGAANAGGIGGFSGASSSSGEASGGDASDPAGAGGGDGATCDLDGFWRTIAVGAVGTGQCQLQDPPASDGGAVDRLHASVVIDHDGRVVDNTGLMGEEKRQWLKYAVGDQRWPCLADQTIGYSCTPLGR